jgi:hypothetical protein
MSINRGLDAKLYRGTAGSTAATLVNNVRDLNYDSEWTEEDMSTRGSTFELSVATMQKVSVNWEMLADDADVDLDAIRSAHETRTPLAFKIVDKAGGKGIDADWIVIKCSRKQGLKGVITYDVSIKPTYVSRYPAHCG